MDLKNTQPSFPHPLPLESNMNTDHIEWVYGSHAPGIRKAMKILEAQFSHSNASSSSSVHNNEDVINIYNNNMMMNIYNDVYRPNLLVARSSQSHEPSLDQAVVAFADGDDYVGVHFKKKNLNDGRIHSLPHKKYGPYTCPKCYQVLATSQKFASHVTSNHYKFDSAEERRKRYMFRARKKPSLQICKIDNGQTTFVHVVSSIDQPPLASTVNNDDQNQSSPSVLPLNGVKLELDLVDG
ncbi:unnamed protein product [Lathyrus sativus]|nr:unnamed protein product [Lathyrus sativus]